MDSEINLLIEEEIFYPLIQFSSQIDYVIRRLVWLSNLKNVGAEFIISRLDGLIQSELLDGMELLESKQAIDNYIFTKPSIFG